MQVIAAYVDERQAAMKRPLYRLTFFVASSILFLALSQVRALALVEYCGADVTAVPVAAAAPSDLYALTLSAHSARDVSGVVVMHAGANFYRATIDKTALTEYQQRYQNITFQFTRTTYESNPIFVRLPQAASITSAYFDSITVTNEHTLGWDTAPHTCAGIEPAAAPLVKTAPVRTIRSLTLLNPQPIPSLAAGAPVVVAQSIPAPGKTDCDVPFKEASVLHVTAPRYPNQALAVTDKYMTLLDVAVNAQGGIDDISIFAPSGIKVFDLAALRSARDATYSPGRAFCQNVPGVYRFRAEFRPH